MIMAKFNSKISYNVLHDFLLACEISTVRALTLSLCFVIRPPEIFQ